MSTPFPESVAFDPSLDIDVARMTRTPTGVLYHDLVTGTGDEAVDGKSLDMFYTGWLSDGTRFDSNVGGRPFSFRLGSDRVIDGWHQGIPGMRVGGTRQIVIPPAQGYGNQTYGPIPGGSVLVFKVELAGVR